MGRDIRLYTRRVFKSKETVSSTKFVRRTPTISELMVKDVGFPTIKVNVETIVEMEVDVPPLVYMNCSLSSRYIIQYTTSSLL